MKEGEQGRKIVQQFFTLTHTYTGIRLGNRLCVSRDSFVSNEYHRLSFCVESNQQIKSSVEHMEQQYDP